MDYINWLKEMKELDNTNENNYNNTYRIAKALEIIADYLINQSNK